MLVLVGFNANLRCIMQHFAIHVENGIVTRVSVPAAGAFQAVVIEDGEARRRLVVERDLAGEITAWCLAAREQEQLVGLAMACDVLSGAMRDMSKSTFASYAQACGEVDAVLAVFKDKRVEIDAVD